VRTVASPWIPADQGSALQLWVILGCTWVHVDTAPCRHARRCALLGIRDPALQCKLFDTLVLPILSYGCEVWGVDTKSSAAAEALHRDFLRRLLGVRKSTANHMVLAELGRFPLQVHFWQQILRYHHRTTCVLLSSQWLMALLCIRQQSKTVGR